MIRSSVYGEEERALVVRFVSGKVNTYQDVPAEVVDGLRAVGLEQRSYRFVGTVEDLRPAARG